MRIEPTRIRGILALDANGGIGVNGRLPWTIRKDLFHFKQKTMGKPMVMGRKTFESFENPLPGRLHLVLTRDTDFTCHHPDVKVFYDPRSLMSFVNGFGGTVYVIGGAEIFRLLHHYIDEYILTEIQSTFEVDTHFHMPHDEFMQEYELVDSIHEQEHEHHFYINTYVRR